MKRNMGTVQLSVCVPRKRGTLTAIGCSTPQAMRCPRLLESRLFFVSFRFFRLTERIRK